MAGGVDREIYGDTPGAQVVDAQDGRHDIPREVVKDQHLPYRLARVGENGRVGRLHARTVGVGGLFGGIEVQDALDGGWALLVSRLSARRVGMQSAHLSAGREVKPWSFSFFRVYVGICVSMCLAGARPVVVTACAGRTDGR